MDAWGLCATKTNGLYYTEDLRPTEAYDPVWEQVGNVLAIGQIDYDENDQLGLQVARYGTTAVYIRRTSVSDNWTLILTEAQIRTLIGDSSGGTINWVAYNSYKPGYIYVLWNYYLTQGGVWCITSTDYGNSWSAYSVNLTLQNYRATCIRAGRQAIVGDPYGSGGIVYCTCVLGLFANWVTGYSLNDGQTWTFVGSPGQGQFDFLDYVDPLDQSIVYSCNYSIPDPFNLTRRSGYAAAFVEIDGAAHYGILSGASMWVWPGNTNYLRVFRDNQLRISDNYAVSWSSQAVTPIFTSSSLYGITPSVLGWGRPSGVTAIDPHHVFTTPNTGVTIYGKGGVQGSGNEIPHTAGGVAIDGFVMGLTSPRFQIALGGIAKMSGRTIKGQENTVYLRRAETFDPFEHGGACMRIEDIVKPRGTRNPTYCQNVRDGGVEITGTLQGLPGLPTSTLVLKETQFDTMADELENCLWDIDRRTHCRNLDAWDQWEKIRRICAAKVDTRTDQGSVFDEDDRENLTTLPVVGMDVSTIRRVNVSITQSPKNIAANWVDISVCHGERCGSRCDNEDECIVAAVTGKAGAGDPYLFINNRGGHPSYWTETAMTELTAAAPVAIICLGDFILIATDGDTDDDLVRSYDQGVTRMELTGSADIATNHIGAMDAITQAFIVAVGGNGYVYTSTDGGSFWITADNGVATAEDLSNVMICHEDSSIIYAIGANNALIKSENGGQTWFALTGPCAADDDLTALWVENETHILIGNDDGELWESNDGGESWTQQDNLPGVTATATQTIIRDITGCGCGVLWLIWEDTTVTCYTTDSEQYLFRNVDGGASGRWYVPEGGHLTPLTHLQVPKSIACCGPNRAIVVGGEATAPESGFVAVAA